MHDVWIWGGTRIDDVNHSFIVNTKQNPFARPMRTPNMGCQHNREEFLVGNRQMKLMRKPCSIEPFSVQHCAIANCTRCIRTNREIWDGCKGGKEEKGNPIPLTKEFHPPSQVFPKLQIKTNGTRIIPETRQ